MTKKIIAAILGLSFSFSLLALSPSDYQKGWEAFIRNNRQEARQYFTQALSNPECKADAYLSLSLLDQSEEKLPDAFENFRQFYNSSSNPYPYFMRCTDSRFYMEARGYWKIIKLHFLKRLSTIRK